MASGKTSERTDRMKEITDRLEAGVKELFESDRYRTWLTTMSRFHNYSLNNTLLIAMQRPDATLVAGYGAWQQKFGRQVKKGARAIRILAPAPYKKTVLAEKTDPDTGEILFNPDGSAVKEKQVIQYPAFKIVNVFDVSDTEGRELPTIGVNELSGNVADYADFMEALKQVCPVPVSYEDIPGGAKGYFHTVENRIALQVGMSEVQTVKTLIHEMAHQKLHSGDKKQSRNSRETEAESVAFCVCSHYGIDTSDYSFAYIAGYADGKELPELKASLNTIRQAASEMITEIDDRLQDRKQMREPQKQPSVLAMLKENAAKIAPPEPSQHPIPEEVR